MNAKFEKPLPFFLKKIVFSYVVFTVLIILNVSSWPCLYTCMQTSKRKRSRRSTRSTRSESREHGSSIGGAGRWVDDRGGSAVYSRAELNKNVENLDDDTANDSGLSRMRMHPRKILWRCIKPERTDLPYPVSPFEITVSTVFSVCWKRVNEIPGWRWDRCAYSGVLLSIIESCIPRPKWKDRAIFIGR